MPNKDNRLAQGIAQVANLMSIAARTAPKGKGLDRVVVRILEGAEKDRLAKMMEDIAASGYNARIFERDAQNLRNSAAVLVLGSTLQYMGLDCGYCGFPTCAECQEKGARCAFDAIDLGIAIGSAAATAADMRVDNRLMYTIGYAATKNQLLGEEVAFAIGIPLAAAGKNIFFDRT